MTTSNKKILAVDDNLDNLEVIRDLFEDAYDVVTAESGDACMEIAPEEKPDLILLDIMMPGIDGYETCRQLRANPLTAGAKIIMVSAKAMTSERVAGYEVGADDYVTKPFEHDELVAKVKVYLRLKYVEDQDRAKSDALDALQAKQDELSAAKAELEIAWAKAENSNRTKSEFLANMSHEIRTPMTAILGYVDVLEDSRDESVYRTAIKTIRSNGRHLLSILNDILDVSKLEAGKLEVEKIACAPGAVIQEAVDLLRVRAKERGLTLNAECAGPIPTLIQSDPTRLRQILLNLIGNAIKFTEEGGVRVIVGARKNGVHEGELRIDVQDTGIGLNEEQISTLFQRFGQADTSTTRKFGGTGLGLTICKRLTVLLGGDVQVQSKPGAGSTFSVTISTGSLEHAEATTSLTEIREIPPSVVLRKSDFTGRVLLAEDTPDIERVISFHLGRAGLEVTAVENGLLAVEAARQAEQAGTPFDIVLCDMQMPVMDGYTAVAQLRAEGYTGPIVALTAHAMLSDRQKCIDAGCDDYFTKPIEKKALLNLVADHLSNSKEAGS